MDLLLEAEERALVEDLQEVEVAPEAGDTKSDNTSIIMRTLELSVFPPYVYTYR